MKHLYLNLKRFDIPPAMGGVNRIAPVLDWGHHIIASTQGQLQAYSPEKVRFAMFFPEAHIASAVKATCAGSVVGIGCQSVHRDDSSIGGNFGAFTTNRTANSMKALGCTDVIIGHCEERLDKLGILTEAGATNSAVVSRLLNQQAICAQKAGLRILFCIGETAEQQDHWQEVLQTQLETGLRGLEPGGYAVAYEPVWAIGPGKTPPGRDYIQMVARFIKEATGGAPVIYGGGLKTENAAMLASIPEVDGGLIALTRFTGEVGFYPEEYLEIVKTYMEETIS